MLVPVGEPIAVPVDVICVGGPDVRVLRGSVRGFDQRLFEVVLRDPTIEVSPGTRVVLDLGGDFGGRVRASVASSGPGHLRALLHKVVPPEKRVFPRLLGTMPLRWRSAPEGWREQEIQSWLEGATPRSLAGTWSTPDPLMNFSVNGLQFEDLKPPAPDALVLLEMSVANGSNRWRATARVVRVAPVLVSEASTPGMRVTPHTIAVEFVHLPDAAREALTTYTLQRQEHVA